MHRVTDRRRWRPLSASPHRSGPHRQGDFRAGARWDPIRTADDRALRYRSEAVVGLTNLRLLCASRPHTVHHKPAGADPGGRPTFRGATHGPGTHMSPPGLTLNNLRLPALLLGLGIMARIGLRVRSDPRHFIAKPEPDRPARQPMTPPVDPYIERMLRSRQRRPIDAPMWVDRLADRIAVMDGQSAPARSSSSHRGRARGRLEN